MGDRVFTLDEATALLPRLRELLGAMRGIQGELNADQLRHLRQATAGNGGGPAAHEMLEAVERLRRLVAEIEEIGVVVRDPISGLVDFPADRDGEPVFLCWRIDEDAIGHWHDRTSGFAGRQPL